MATLCKDYKPRDKGNKQNCPNCYRWVGAECINHSVMVSNVIVAGRIDKTDRIMRTNKGVWVG